MSTIDWDEEMQQLIQKIVLACEEAARGLLEFLQAPPVSDDG